MTQKTGKGLRKTGLLVAVLLIATLVASCVQQVANPQDSPLYPETGHCSDYECVAYASQACDETLGVKFDPAKYREPAEVENYFYSGWQSNACTITRSLRTAEGTQTQTCTFTKDEMADVQALANKISGSCFT